MFTGLTAISGCSPCPHCISSYITHSNHSLVENRCHEATTEAPLPTMALGAGSAFNCRKILHSAAVRCPTQDQGVVLLMEDRFARAEVQNLLPGWWQAGGS